MTISTSPAIHPDAIQSLLHGDHGSPFDLLGAHPVYETTAEGAVSSATSIRAFNPFADSLQVREVATGTTFPMHKLHPDGFFELTLQGAWTARDYVLVAKTATGSAEQVYADAYAFPPLLTEFDLHLYAEGHHYYSYGKFGAHLCEIDGVKGVSFAVWAPNAYRVSVVGSFNRWDPRVYPMRCHWGAGVWEIFIPGLQAGDVYKFDIRSRVGGYHTEKADPYAFGAELRPRTASVVIDLDDYVWNDTAWMTARADDSALKKPLSIYEVHLGSWRREGEQQRWLTYRELADQLVSYVKDMGYTHVELLPIAEHPFDGSWGYQVTGYFAPTSRFGTPQDFMYFVDVCHQNGIGVILDWVPAHFPKDGFALSYFDGTHLYEHADPRQGEHPDWGTYIFNYGRNEVRNFLIANALFWLKVYHIDGLRVDAVASMLYLDYARKAGEWIPNQYGGRENLAAIAFMQEVNSVVHNECPGAITIAEESTAWPMVSRPTYIGGLGFTFKWNMGWMHDTLEYIKIDPVYRRYHHNKLTFTLMYAFSENFVLSLSHDEVVHLKGSLITKAAGDWWQKFATLRLLFGFQYTHPGKKLNFMGAEFGQWREWSEARSLDWYLTEQFETHAKLQSYVRDLNKLYQAQPALYQQDFNSNGFRWIEANDAEQSVFSFMRFADDPSDFLVIACNFTPVPRLGYRVGVPDAGRYVEIFNSDSAHYGGSNVGSNGSAKAEAVRWHAFEHSLSLTLPPLGLVILKPEHSVL